MSTFTTTPTPLANINSSRTLKPSFFGMVRGELSKLRLQRATWILLILLILIIIIPFLVSLNASSIQNSLTKDPAGFLPGWLDINLALFRAMSGFLLIILTARLIGQEYSQGTIRILLARGVGRVHLLLAKLLAALIWGIFFLIIDLALNVVLNIGLIEFQTGSLDALNTLNATFWQNAGLYVLTLLINMAATILLTGMLSVLGRSLAFGLSTSLI